MAMDFVLRVLKASVLSRPAMVRQSKSSNNKNDGMARRRLAALEEIYLKRFSTN